MTKIAVIAAHPDDEVLGCGATIARHVALGDEVHVLLMTDGVSARGESGAAADGRRRAMEQALSILGVKTWRLLDLPDNEMDSRPLLKIIQAIEPMIEEMDPSIIYTHFHGDLNVDHRITHQAVMTACRPQPGCSVTEIFCFEVPSSTDWAGSGQAMFQPNVFVDVTDHWDIKARALNAYSLEMRTAPHARSIDALDMLSRTRGASVGMQRAEAFVCMRRLVR